MEARTFAAPFLDFQLHWACPVELPRLERQGGRCRAGLKGMCNSLMMPKTGLTSGLPRFLLAPLACAGALDLFARKLQQPRSPTLRGTPRNHAPLVEGMEREAQICIDLDFSGGGGPPHCPASASQLRAGLSGARQPPPSLGSLCRPPPTAQRLLHAAGGK